MRYRSLVADRDRGRPAVTVEALLGRLESRLLPEPRQDAEDPFAEAWRTGTDLDAMIGLLRLGGTIGLFGIEEVSEWTAPQTRTVSRWLFRLQRPDGTYVRVDVKREDGPDGLRAILPAIPPLEAWRRALDADYARRDPLDQYLLDMKLRGRPSPGWTERWGVGDAGLAAAWDASLDGPAMRELMHRLRREPEHAAAQRAFELVEPWPGRSAGRRSPEGWFEVWKVRLAAAIRRAVPQPFRS